MSLFSRLFGADRAQNDTPAENISENAGAVENAATRDLTDNGELVAVITAAIMNMLSGDAVTDLRIKAIRRTGRNSPVWNIAGRDEYLAMKL